MATRSRAAIDTRKFRTFWSGLSMADTTRWAALGVVLVTAACGGSAAMAPTAASPAVDPVVADPAPSRNAEPPPSKELVEGIKAFDAGQYPEARSLFEAAVKKNKADYEALYNLGMASEKVGDKAAAEAAYQSALETKPDLDTASAELSALYIDEGRADVAITVARAGLAKHPGSAALHENLGIALAARDEADEATRELEAAIQIAPADPMLQLTLAHWLNVWHVRGAAPHLDAARARAKGDYGLIASVGHEYRMAGEFDSCVQTFDSAIAIRDGGEVRTERALCRLGLKDEPGTLDDLQAAVDKEPTYAPAHYYLGGRLATAGRFKDAAAEYAKYLELEPGGSLAKPARDRLKATRDAMSKQRGAAAKKK
jgi:tetratricopeptide (TPR) repeat protein